jgi:hypothetical protein
MDVLKKLLNKLITKDALDHKIRCAKRLRLEKQIYFYSNLEKLLQNYINSEFVEQRSSGLIHDASRHEMFATLNPELAKTKITYETVQELREEMMDEGGQASFASEFELVKDFSMDQTPRELEHGVKKQSHWKLKQSEGEVNFFNFETMRQEYRVNTVYQLESTLGTTCEFDTADIPNQIIHVLMFTTAKKYHGNYFHTLAEFSSLLALLIDETSADAVYSPFLSYPTADELAPLTSKQIEKKQWPEPWRFKKIRNSNDSKLLRTWQMMGGVMLPVEGMNPNNLYFNSPEKALEVKQMVEESENDHNPFKYLSNKSIYNEETVKQLCS